MSQIILKNIPSTIAFSEINFAQPKSINKEAIIEAIEYLEDLLYIKNRDKPEFIEENEVMNLISKYK